VSGLGSCSVRFLAAIVVVALAPVRLAAGTETAKERFSRALAEAKANLATPVGHEYDRVLAAYFSQQNAPILQRCFKTTDKPDVTAFEMVFRLAKSGRVLEALPWPETNVGMCLRDGLKAKTFPSPPREAYWAQMRTSFGP